MDVSATGIIPIERKLMSKSQTPAQRPPIPAETRRRVLVEAGHRCAIPTCRHIDTEVHHIVPWAKCREHKYENLIALCPNCHSRADQGDIDRKSLRLYKANLRFIHDKFSQLEIDVLYQAYNSDAAQPILWPSFMHIFLGRILEAGYIECHSKDFRVVASGLNITPDDIYITAAGREFIESIGVKEM